MNVASMRVGSRSVVWATAPALMAVGLSISCASDSSSRQTVTIYTSIYENVIAELGPRLREAFPDLDVQFFQRGSEDVAARLNSEIAAGRVAADLVMTSDPFWYEELKEAGHLLAYRSPRASGIPAELNDPDGTFVTVRMPVMVIGVNTDRVPAGSRPRTFRELADVAWAKRVSMGDPNRSGSYFTAVAALEQKYGQEYFELLRRNDIVAAGGNSAVLNRLTTGERDVGIVLLENILQARQQNARLPVEAVYPEDGVILVPSPIAVLSATKVPDAARRIYDFFLSDEGQQALVGGWMYSPFAHIAPPLGGRPWPEVYSATLIPWTFEHLRQTTKAREDIKRRFTSIVLEPR
ncbi:MAG: ABC transporter substrate-binding protein [Acidobacteriota bacterium]